MAKRTKEQIQKEVKEAAAKRKQEYFAAQAEAKNKAIKEVTEIGSPDAYQYFTQWKQEAGSAGGRFANMKIANPFYDPSTNTIVDLATGERIPATQSIVSTINSQFPNGIPSTAGKSVNSVIKNVDGSFTVRYSDGTRSVISAADAATGVSASVSKTSGLDVKDPITGLTPAQMDAAKALAAAKGDAEKLAAQLGAKIDPKTGKIDKNTIDPVKAAAWYKTQVNIDGDKIVDVKGNKTIINRVVNPNGTVTIFYSDGTSETVEADGVKTSTSTGDSGLQTLVQSLQAQIASMTAMQQQNIINQAAADAAAKKEKAENAISSLTNLFSRYGLSSLVPKIKELAISGASEATITLQLQDTEEYKQRFRGNTERLKKGLSYLTPGDYIGLEDSYRQILRAYGLKQFDTDEYVTQFIANDVSTAELSSRVTTAVQRVQNADPTVLRTLRDYYGIGVNDMVAYVLDPNQQFPKIERQVAAAEIGTAARRQGLEAGVGVAEQLAAQGISQAEAQRGYSTIADILPQATKLSQIYGDVLDQYGQSEAEQEVFNSLASAQRKRQKLIEREAAAFAGSSGLGRTSLTGNTGGTF